MTVVLPALSKAFATDISVVIWVTVVYYLVSTGLMLSAGWVGDVLGRKRVLALGFLIFALGAGLSAMAENIYQLIGLRVLTAVGAAGILSSEYAIIAAVFPGRERGRALGINSAIVGLGLALGPLVGGILLDHLGWRSVFYFRAPIALLGVVLTWWLLRDDRGVKGAVQTDVLGGVLLFISLATFLAMVNQGGRLGLGSPVVWVLALAVVILLPLLLKVERRARRPVLDLEFLRKPANALTMLSLIFHYLAWGSFNAVAAFFLLQGKGFSQSMAGLLLATFPFMRFLFGPLAGAASDRVGTRRLIIAGNVLLVVGLLVLSSLDADAGWARILVGFLLMGLGPAVFEPSNTSHFMGSTSRDRLGTASASISTGRQIGLSGGLAVAGAVYAWRKSFYQEGLLASGAGADQANVFAVTWGFRDASLACVAVAALALLASLGSYLATRHAAPQPVLKRAAGPQER
ncbi:MAG: MFS transporter [Chloroflexi bacterium]|nr:MFS transporter [Chloroflexota bacterium]